MTNPYKDDETLQRWRNITKMTKHYKEERSITKMSKHKNRWRNITKMTKHYKGHGTWQR